MGVLGTEDEPHDGATEDGQDQHAGHNDCGGKHQGTGQVAAEGRTAQAGDYGHDGVADRASGEGHHGAQGLGGGIVARQSWSQEQPDEDEIGAEPHRVEPGLQEQRPGEDGDAPRQPAPQGGQHEAQRHRRQELKHYQRSQIREPIDGQEQSGISESQECGRNDADQLRQVGEDIENRHRAEVAEATLGRPVCRVDGDAEQVHHYGRNHPTLEAGHHSDGDDRHAADPEHRHHHHEPVAVIHVLLPAFPGITGQEAGESGRGVGNQDRPDADDDKGIGQKPVVDGDQEACRRDQEEKPKESGHEAAQEEQRRRTDQALAPDQAAAGRATEGH